MGWRPSEGLKAFMNTRRKMRQFYCRKTVWLDGGKIKAVRAENIPHYLVFVVLSIQPLLRQSGITFLYKKGKKMSKFNKTNSHSELVSESQTGRSMVEMLGVLAIIGVLSVGGIAGYTSAMRQYKANEIVNATSMLYMMGASQNQGNGDKQMLYSGTLGTVPSGVSEITYNADKTITLAFTDTDVCPLVKNKLGDKATGECPTLTVTFSNDMISPTSECGEHGHKVNEKCVCDTNWYGDLCDSDCDGFKNLYGDCLPCSSDNLPEGFYDALPSECAKCGNTRESRPQWNNGSLAPSVLCVPPSW